MEHEDESGTQTEDSKTETTKTGTANTEDNGSGSQPKEVTKDGFNLDGALEEIRKLRQEAANYRVKAKNAEEAKNGIQSQLTDALNSLNQVETKAKEYEATLTKLQNEQKTLALKSQLVGKVIDPDKALKLVEDKHYDEEGIFQLDKFLEDNPFLAQNDQKVSSPVNNGGNQPAADTQKLLEGKDAKWIAANWDKLMSNK